MIASQGIASEVAGFPHGRVPRTLRERQVLAAAEDLFAEAGFAGASMDELARRVGVSKPVIYGLVGSKDQLFRRCVERQAEVLAERITRAVAAESDPEAQLRAGSLAFFSFVGEHRRLWEALTVEPSPFAAEVAGIRRRQDELIGRQLAAAAGHLGVALPVDRLSATAGAINGANEALARWWRDHDELTPDQLTALSVDLLLPGLQRLLTTTHAAAV